MKRYLPEIIRNFNTKNLEIDYKIIIERSNLWFYLGVLIAHKYCPKVNVYSNKSFKIPSEAKNLLKNNNNLSCLKIMHLKYKKSLSLIGNNNYLSDYFQQIDLEKDDKMRINDINENLIDENTKNNTPKVASKASSNSITYIDSSDPLPISQSLPYPLLKPKPNSHPNRYEESKMDPKSTSINEKLTTICKDLEPKIIKSLQVNKNQTI